MWPQRSEDVRETIYTTTWALSVNDAEKLKTSETSSMKQKSEGRKSAKAARLAFL